MYQSAQANPNKFYIGIDANPRQLEKISEKIHRKPALPNAMFVQAAIEDLPEELDGVADEVHVHFPWGSLLRAVATGEAAAALRRICAPGALLEVVIGVDHERDRVEIERLGLESFSVDAIDAAYNGAGFEIVERGTLAASEQSCVRTSWAKRLSQGATRKVVYFIARADESRLL